MYIKCLEQSLAGKGTQQMLVIPSCDLVYCGNVLGFTNFSAWFAGLMTGLVHLFWGCLQFSFRPRKTEETLKPENPGIKWV